MQHMNIKPLIPIKGSMKTIIGIRSKNNSIMAMRNMIPFIAGHPFLGVCL